MIWHSLWHWYGLYMDFVWAIGFHIKPIDVTVPLVMEVYCLLLRDFYVFGTVPYISHSVYYGNAMAQPHPKTEPHYYGTATYFAPSHSIPIAFKHTAADMGLLWVTKDHRIPIPSKLTAADMGLLWVTEDHRIPIPSKVTVADMGLLWVTKDHGILIPSKLTSCS